MVDSENEELMEIHSSADTTDCENDRPGSSMSTTTSSTFCQSMGGFAEMEDTVPSIIDVCLFFKSYICTELPLFALHLFLFLVR